MLSAWTCLPTEFQYPTRVPTGLLQATLLRGSAKSQPKCLHLHQLSLTLPNCSPADRFRLADQSTPHPIRCRRVACNALGCTNQNIAPKCNKAEFQMRGVSLIFASFVIAGGRFSRYFTSVACYFRGRAMTTDRRK